MGSLDGKSTIITGAAKGIGRATARVFAREGARLALADVDEGGVSAIAAELQDGGADVMAQTTDVAQEPEVERLVDAATGAYGRLDVLVANAGIIPLTTLDRTTVEEWDHVMAVDGRGMFLCCKHAVRAMLPSGGGSIVCLSSISGLAGQAQQAAYGPAKFVASGLTKHLAVEWAARGIRVNAVAPGTIRTEAVARLPDEYVEPMRRAHPMQRLGEPSEVGEAIAFLASDAASFITGAILAVDGGYLAQ